jgi:hypothetical protein
MKETFVIAGITDECIILKKKKRRNNRRSKADKELPAHSNENGTNIKKIFVSNQNNLLILPNISKK